MNSLQLLITLLLILCGFMILMSIPREKGKHVNRKELELKWLDVNAALFTLLAKKRFREALRLVKQLKKRSRSKDERKVLTELEDLLKGYV